MGPEHLHMILKMQKECRTHLSQQAREEAWLDVVLQIMRSPELISFPLALVPCPSHIAQGAYQHQCHQQSQPHLKPAKSVQLLLHSCTDAHTEQYFSQSEAVRRAV
jgi:hypothetical protein